MFGRATITLGIGPHSSYVFAVVCSLAVFGIDCLKNLWINLLEICVILATRTVSLRFQERCDLSGCSCE